MAARNVDSLCLHCTIGLWVSVWSAWLIPTGDLIANATKKKKSFKIRETSVCRRRWWGNPNGINVWISDTINQDTIYWLEMFFFFLCFASKNNKIEENHFRNNNKITKWTENLKIQNDLGEKRKKKNLHLKIVMSTFLFIKSIKFGFACSFFFFFRLVQLSIYVFKSRKKRIQMCLFSRLFFLLPFLWYSFNYLKWKWRHNLLISKTCPFFPLFILFSCVSFTMILSLKKSFFFCHRVFCSVCSSLFARQIIKLLFDSLSCVSFSWAGLHTKLL